MRRFLGKEELIDDNDAKQMELDNNTESGNENDTSVDEPIEKQCKFNETIKKDDTKYADLKLYMKYKKDSYN